MSRLFTSESVTEGHPDKICDQISDAILDDMLRQDPQARVVGVTRVFCLTFETEFFGRHGFVEIEGAPVTKGVYAELLQSYDEGVAEFLDLDRVKPNTLGNTRMLLHLT